MAAASALSDSGYSSPDFESVLPHTETEFEAVITNLRKSILDPSNYPLDQSLKPITGLLQVKPAYTLHTALTDLHTKVQASSTLLEALYLDSPAEKTPITHQEEACYALAKKHQPLLEEIASVLKYPVEQNPKYLPPETAQVALSILSGNPNPFKDHTEGVKLGKGMFAEVRDVTVADKHYAAKTPHRTRLMPYVVDAEYSHLTTLEHPHIITVLHVAYPTLYMPRLQGCTLNATTSSLSSQNSIKALAQIANALSYMHAKGVIHNDVNGSNIMITEQGNAMLIDLGRASTELLPTEDINMFGRMILTLLDDDNISDLPTSFLKNLATRCKKGTISMADVEKELLAALPSST